ncbi:MAG: hypothetical protein GXY14_14880 [Spirochaetes bacterium]|nr:hypothetical protein [Spirochaetota bacterium]
MIRSIIVAVILISAAYLLTSNYTGYSTAGKEYYKKAREERKSLRAGSGYYAPYMGGSGSFRSGK